VSSVANAPLPVVLTDFTVARVGTAAKLSWHTASEVGNAYFAAEVSQDGTTFTSLGQVPGQGTSTQAQSYTFTDANLGQYAASTVYYRLRQVDTDGQSVYSPVRTLASTALATATPAATGSSLQVYPNPASATARVLVKVEAGAQVQLLDVRGQLIAQASAASDGSVGLSTSGLAAGLYIVRCGAQNTKLLLTN
jgi:hypothetical protein